jgi:hypothetical protein
VEVGELINAAFALPRLRKGRLSWRGAWSHEELASVAFAIERARDGDLGIRLTYVADGGVHIAQQFVGLEITQPYFGGSRYWFICPGADEDHGCAARARMLYLPAGADRFACRACHDLTYTSRRASHRYDGMLNGLAGFLPSEGREGLRALLR